MIFFLNLGSSHHTRIKIVLLPTNEQNYAPKYLHPKYLHEHEVEVKDEYVPSSVPPPSTSSIASDDIVIVTPNVIPTVTPKVTPKVTSKVTPKVTPTVTANVSPPPDTMVDDALASM